MELRLIRLTAKDRLVLIQTLLSPKEKGKKYEERRARRRVCEALGVRRGVHWEVFRDEEADGRKIEVIAIGGLRDGKFLRASKLADRVAVVSSEALDLVLGAIDRHSGDVGDEDALLDLEEKLRAKHDDKQEDIDGLPGVNDRSDGDVFLDEVGDEESLAPEGAVTT